MGFFLDSLFCAAQAGKEERYTKTEKKKKSSCEYGIHVFSYVRQCESRVMSVFASYAQILSGRTLMTRIKSLPYTVHHTPYYVLCMLRNQGQKAPEFAIKGVRGNKPRKQVARQEKNDGSFSIKIVSQGTEKDSGVVRPYYAF